LPGGQPAAVQQVLGGADRQAAAHGPLQIEAAADFDADYLRAADDFCGFSAEIIGSPMAFAETL
jgi:hypothetical protein